MRPTRGGRRDVLDESRQSALSHFSYMPESLCRQCRVNRREMLAGLGGERRYVCLEATRGASVVLVVTTGPKPRRSVARSRRTPAQAPRARSTVSSLILEASRDLRTGQSLAFTYHLSDLPARMKTNCGPSFRIVKVMYPFSRKEFTSFGDATSVTRVLKFAMFSSPGLDTIAHTVSAIL